MYSALTSHSNAWSRTPAWGSADSTSGTQYRRETRPLCLVSSGELSRSCPVLIVHCNRTAKKGHRNSTTIQGYGALVRKKISFHSLYKPYESTSYRRSPSDCSKLCARQAARPKETLHSGSPPKVLPSVPTVDTCKVRIPSYSLREKSRSNSLPSTATTS